MMRRREQEQNWKVGAHYRVVCLDVELAWPGKVLENRHGRRRLGERVRVEKGLGGLAVL